MNPDVQKKQNIEFGTESFLNKFLNVLFKFLNSSETLLW